MANERLEAEKALMVKTLTELKALLTQAEVKMDILMNLEPMHQRAAFSLRKHLDDSNGVVDMLLCK